VLSDLPPQTDPRVLIDFRTADDAGVYTWEAGPALVQTVDFFTPIVDDAYTYGQIAAANALSDIYAMGGTPLTALAVAGFPDGVLDAATIRQIFLGGYDKLREAGVSLLGGHTVRDPEVKFGYAVTGAIDPSRVLTKAGARADDVLLLTKPLGTGIAGTAIKFSRAPAATIASAIASMTTLNRRAAEALSTFGHEVHACTDITGFGLIGHATEMAAASAVTLEIRASLLPLLPAVREMAPANRSRGLGSNREHFETTTQVSPEVDPALADVAYDPQTSGGLLAAIAPHVADRAWEALSDAAGVVVHRVGRVAPPDTARVRLLP
jgi:selenide, water dikinase